MYDVCQKAAIQMGRKREPASLVAVPLSFVHTNKITRCRGNPCGCPLRSRNPASALLHLLPHDRLPPHFATLLSTAVICVFCRGASRTARWVSWGGRDLCCPIRIPPNRNRREPGFWTGFIDRAAPRVHRRRSI